MGLMQLLASILGQGNSPQQSRSNPAEDWLRQQQPGLFQNGEQLPLPPQGWTTPPIAPPTSAFGGQDELPPTGQAPTMPPMDASTAQSAPAPAHRKRGGVLGALESIFAPEPGSFMWSAMNNGIYNAKAGQDDYQYKRQLQEAALKTAKTKGEFQIAGNNLVHYKPEGGYEIITPPQTPGEQERLFQRWSVETDPQKKTMLARMLRGVQYTPEVIEAQGRARTTTGVAIAGVRGAETRKTNAAKPDKGLALPTGAKIIG